LSLLEAQKRLPSFLEAELLETLLPGFPPQQKPNRLPSFLEAELLETPDSINIDRAFPMGRNFTHHQSKSQPNRSHPVKSKYTHTQPIMARDRFYELVHLALENDGWSISNRSIMKPRQPENVTQPLWECLQAQREQIIAIAAMHGAYNVRVFGSVARGEETADSDIDFLLDYDPAEITPWFPGGLLMDLQDLLGRRVDVLTECGVSPLIKDKILMEARPL
jgi:predicted nucleotidyltransferase